MSTSKIYSEVSYSSSQRKNSDIEVVNIEDGEGDQKADKEPKPRQSPNMILFNSNLDGVGALCNPPY